MPILPNSPVHYAVYERTYTAYTVKNLDKSVYLPYNIRILNVVLIWCILVCVLHVMR